MEEDLIYISESTLLHLSQYPFNKTQRYIEWHKMAKSKDLFVVDAKGDTYFALFRAGKVLLYKQVDLSDCENMCLDWLKYSDFNDNKNVVSIDAKSNMKDYYVLFKEITVKELLDNFEQSSKQNISKCIFKHLNGESFATHCCYACYDNESTIFFTRGVINNVLEYKVEGVGDLDLYKESLQKITQNAHVYHALNKKGSDYCESVRYGNWECKVAVNVLGRGDMLPKADIYWLNVRNGVNFSISVCFEKEDVQ